MNSSHQNVRPHLRGGPLREESRDFFEDEVANGVTVVVVYTFEMVRIDHENGYATVKPSARAMASSTNSRNLRRLFGLSGHRL